MPKEKKEDIFATPEQIGVEVLRTLTTIDGSGQIEIINDSLSSVGTRTKTKQTSRGVVIQRALLRSRGGQEETIRRIIVHD